MQPATGQTFTLPIDPDEAKRERDAHVGKLLDVAELERLQQKVADSPVAGHEVTPAHDLDAALRSAREHGPLVGVPREVAHAQRLGQRELERRRKRNRSAKQARKANR